MGKTVFVPLNDDLLYEHPEMILGPVIPFSQQARWSPVKPASFSLVTPALDAETKLKPSVQTRLPIPSWASLRSR